MQLIPFKWQNHSITRMVRIPSQCRSVHNFFTCLFYGINFKNIQRIESIFMNFEVCKLSLVYKNHSRVVDFSMKTLSNSKYFFVCALTCGFYALVHKACCKLPCYGPGCNFLVSNREKITILLELAKQFYLSLSSIRSENRDPFQIPQLSISNTLLSISPKSTTTLI